MTLQMSGLLSKDPEIEKSDLRNKRQTHEFLGRAPTLHTDIVSFVCAEPKCETRIAISVDRAAQGDTADNRLIVSQELMRYF